MRILAGQDQEYQGRMHLSNGIKVGYLQQEPVLDKNSTVLQNIEPALASTKAMLTEFEEASRCLVHISLDMHYIATIPFSAALALHKSHAHGL